MVDALSAGSIPGPSARRTVLVRCPGMDTNLTRRYCTAIARARNQLGVALCLALSEAHSASPFDWFKSS